MKTILFLLILTTFIFSQSYYSNNKSNCRTLLNNYSLQGNNIFNSNYIVKEIGTKVNLPNQTIFTNSFSDSTVQKNNKVFLAGLTGSFGLGLMGAFMGYHVKTNCAGSADVIQICSGDGHYARFGASIGGVSGSILGYLSQRKNIKKDKYFLRIVIGSIVGGVAGYFLTDVSFGISTIIFPPIVANIMLNI